MSHRPVLIGIGVALFAAAPAHAAQIATNRLCYPDARDTGGQAVNIGLTGSGFTPGAQYQVVLDGQPVPGGTGTVNADGTVSGTLPAPAVTQMGEEDHTISVQEGANTPSTTFTVTRVIGDFTPSRGNPRTLKVKFLAFGFGLVADNPTIYVHYVAPNKKVRRTVRLGRGVGRCGRLSSSQRRRLFPFKPERGRWTLQFDTQREYVRGTSSAQFVYAKVGVRIRRLFG